jgi:hypothetical protein
MFVLLYFVAVSHGVVWCCFEKSRSTTRLYRLYVLDFDWCKVGILTVASMSSHKSLHYVYSSTSCRKTEHHFFVVGLPKMVPQRHTMCK